MEPRLGIYIHIPFCASKCGYCDFYSCAGAAARMADYQHALLAHIEESAGRIAPAYIDTVYFGGGTPSFYGAARLIELLDAVKATGRLLKRAEVTGEVNPDSVRLHDLRALHKAGFNRLSIGMQSANNDILKMIGRRHSFHQVEMAVKNARTAGFDNVSLDLIYGLPSQTRSDWADTLAKAIALRPEHISGYGLKLEEGTPMYELKDSPLIPSDDEQADMYLCMVDELRRYGYEQYEISNFSIPGYESRHNLKYWQLDDYMGFGPGAHSCIGRTRYSYVRDLDRYIAGVLHGEDMIDEYETIGDFERAARVLRLHFLEGRFVDAAGVARVAVVRLLARLFSGENELVGVHDDDEVARVDVGRVFGLVLATKAQSDFRGEAAEHLFTGIDHEPVALNLKRLGREGLHCVSPNWLLLTGSHAGGWRRHNGCVSCNEN